MWNFLTLLIQLILSPVNGWNDISYAGKTPRELLFKGFYPIMIITSLSVFLQALYNSDLSFLILFQQSFITFAKYFLSFFIANFLFLLFVDKFTERDNSEKHNQTFIIFSLSLLALSNLLQNCIPMELDVVYFLWIYVAIIMLRGVKYMTVIPDKTGGFMLFSISTVILPQYIIGLIFSMLI